MITIEIAGKDTRKHKKQIGKIIAQLPKNAYYHFLYEPELIIRIYDRHKKYITKYLEKKKIKYKCYRYPFTKKGYGEDKFSPVFIYQKEYLEAMHTSSSLALKKKRKDNIFPIADRYIHTFFNTMGYDWTVEAFLLAQLSGGRIKVIQKYDKTLSLGASYLYSIIILFLGFSIRMMLWLM